MAYPGDILTEWVVKTWNEGNRQLDTNPGVRLVDEDVDQKLYQEATKRRGENIDVYAAALKTTFRDDRAFGYTLDELSLPGCVLRLRVMTGILSYEFPRRARRRSQCNETAVSNYQ